MISQRKPEFENAEQELRSVVQEWDQAMVQNDVEAIDRYMADDWIIVGSDGTSSDKPTFLASIKALNKWVRWKPRTWRST